MIRFLAIVILCVGLAPVYAAVVLQYHHVDTKTPPSTSISPALFQSHLAYLESEGYSVWPLEKIVQHVRDKNALSDKVVAITFDDAFESIYQAAFPLLKKKRYPFTVFVAPEPVDLKRAGYMSWDQMREMQKHGASMANHSYGHIHFVRKLPEESDGDWKQRILGQINRAQERITEELGRAHLLLAYPYGEFTEEIESWLANMGYAAFGQQSGALGINHELTALPRFPMTNVYGEMLQFKTKVASLPLAAIEVAPSQRIVTGKPFSDGFTVVFDSEVRSVNCYFSGRGKLSLEQTGRRIHISDMPDLKPGRSRINCTAPSNKPSQQGRFHWFSYFWMKPLNNGQWYPE